MKNWISLPRAAAKTAKKIVDAVERLKDFPASGRPGKLPHTRELVVPGTPFFLPYRVKGDVAKTSIVQNAWRHGMDLQVHGWIYSLRDGILHDLKVGIGSAGQLHKAYRILGEESG